MDVGVGDGHHAGLGRHGDRVVAGVEQLAGEAVAAVAAGAGADPCAPAG